MGADLLLITLARPKNKKLDWAAGRRVARKLDHDTLMSGLSETFGEAPESVREARSTLNDIISDLKRELTVGVDSRDAYEWEIGRYRVSVRGGTSWGDDPSDGWTAIANAQYFPQVLKAIGFVDAIRYAGS